MTGRSIPPSVTPPSPSEYPNTILTITGITKGSQTKLTVPSHGFVAADVGQTTVMVLQVKGMIQINGMPGRIQSIQDSSNFTVDINSTNFYPYASGGVISIVTGHPPVETLSFQTLNTPLFNTA